MASIDGVLARLVPDRVAASLARRFLRVLGVGAGTRASESGEITVLSRVVRRETPVIFDVGANVGAWSTAALARFPAAQIHAFEPSASHMMKLRETIEGTRVIANACALGKVPGTATLYKDAEITGLASMTRRDLGHKGIKMDLAETVSVDTLDAYALRHGIEHIDYLKIDVEGHELDVLNGALTCFGRGAIGAVQFEFGGCNVDTRTFLRDFYGFFSGQGMKLHRIRPNGRLAPMGTYREFQEQFSTTNYLALPAEGTAR